MASTQSIFGISQIIVLIKKAKLKQNMYQAKQSRTVQKIVCIQTKNRTPTRYKLVKYSVCPQEEHAKQKPKFTILLQAITLSKCIHYICSQLSSQY